MCHFYLWKIKIVTYWHFIPLLLRKPSYHQTKLSSTLWSFEVVSSWCEQAGFILVGATVSYVLAHWDAAAFSSVLYDGCPGSWGSSVQGLEGTWILLVSEMWTLSILLGEWHTSYGRPGMTTPAYCSYSWHWVNRVGAPTRWLLSAICKHCQAGASTLGSEGSSPCVLVPSFLTV